MSAAGLGCQTQKLLAWVAWSTTPASGRGSPPREHAPRARIVEEAAALIHERGVAGTTLDDVKVAAEVSGSQLYHYFPDKNELVQAVIDYPSRHHRQSPAARAQQRERSRSLAEHGDHRSEAHQSKGRLPTWLARWSTRRQDPDTPALVAAGFDQWAAAISDGLRSLHADGKLPSGINPDDLATTLLATLQGGLLLAQVQRSTRPFETAVDTLLALTIGRSAQAGFIHSHRRVGSRLFDKAVA